MVPDFGWAELSLNTCSSPWTEEIVLSEQGLHIDTSASVTLSLHLGEHYLSDTCTLGLHHIIINPAGENTIFIGIFLVQERLEIKHCLRAGCDRL